MWYPLKPGIGLSGIPHHSTTPLSTLFVRSSGDAFPKVYAGVSRRIPCSCSPGCFLTVQSAGIQAPMLVVFNLIFVRPL
jgi:hypothetical protein